MGIAAAICAGIICCAFYLTAQRSKEQAKKAETLTEVQKLITKNLDTKYPETPREVIKLYNRIITAYYAEEYTEEEFVQLALQVRNLYDDELIASKTENQYIEDLRWDVNQLRDQEIVISSYATSASTDVEEYTKGGFKWAKLYCSFTLRKGTYVDSTNEVFLLRKDDAGHWKIYGFKLADDEETRAYQ